MPTPSNLGALGVFSDWNAEAKYRPPKKRSQQRSAPAAPSTQIARRRTAAWRSFRLIQAELHKATGLQSEEQQTSRPSPNPTRQGPHQAPPGTTTQLRRQRRAIPADPTWHAILGLMQFPT